MCNVMWRGEEKTHETRRAARQAHALRRGAVWEREEAEEGQCEWRCDLARRRCNAGIARGAVNSPAATRRRAGARGGGEGTA